MYWIILLVVLGQSPDVAEIRSTLNRIDELSLASLESLSYQNARQQRNMTNKDRYDYTLQTLKNFATTKLNIKPPLQDIEEVILEKLAKKASDTYYRPDPVPVPVLPPPLTFNPITRTGRGTIQQLSSQYPIITTPPSWQDTARIGRVWGWKVGNEVLFIEEQQPPVPPTTTYSPPRTSGGCVNGRCYRR